MGIAMGLKDAGKGFIEMTSDWNTPDPATEFAMVRRVMQACGRPLVFSLKQTAVPIGLLMTGLVGPRAAARSRSAKASASIGTPSRSP